MMEGSIWSVIEASHISQSIKDSVWAYPALETAHLIGLGLLFGAIFAFDIRVLGWNKSLPVTDLGRHLLHWVWAGFGLNATSGLLLFSSDAVDFANNSALKAKLGLIVLAGCNALYFQLRFAPSTAAWNTHQQAPFMARVSAMGSIVLWIAILIAGRLIAYVE